MAEGLSYLIDHIFLPPKLPQKDDWYREKDLLLLTKCEAALSAYQTHLHHEDRRWQKCTLMVQNMLKMRDALGDMSSDRIQEGLGRMAEGGPSVAVNEATMLRPSFCIALAEMLSQLDGETPREAWPVASKAQSKTIEIRDAIHPMFITEMLIGILRGIGEPVNVNRIYKRTRDDVLWNNALLPWRRSPLWLLLRVALQTRLFQDGSDSHNDYKSFMIFFLTQLLELALKMSFPSATLFIMAAKITRRVLKLGADQVSGMEYVHSIVKAAHQELGNRWSAVERNPDPLAVVKAWRSSNLVFSNDTKLACPGLRSYLHNRPMCTSLHSHVASFQPQSCLRIEQTKSQFPNVTYFNSGSDDAVRVGLKDVEVWVENCLDAWSLANVTTENTYALLGDLIDDYTAAAIPNYAEDAEHISLMCLTTMELWVALDRCAVLAHPILSDYEPGFPSALLHPLLLPKRSQLERLAQVEQYIQQRVQKSAHKSSLIFQDISNAKSLSVRYFKQSALHQQLRRDIEQAAERARDRKLTELTDEQREYHRLMQRSDSMSHEEFLVRHRNEETYHHIESRCEKCRVQNQAKSLRIMVHEWPLPYIELEAKSTVFELDVPRTIERWRNVTYCLLVDLFSPQSYSSGSARRYPLRTFDGLSQFCKCKTGRLQLESETKPFVVAHYSTKEIPQATRENICVQNGLHYSMYDWKKDLLTSDLLDRCDLLRRCTLQLPSGAYTSLQYVLDGTKHTSNEALAKQAECPRGLSLHEHYHFVTLRSGHRLQWRNLARELSAQILNFSREETYLLVAQTAWQAGQIGRVPPYRESHIDLEEEEFGTSLLSVLEDALRSVEGNWQGVVALRTFVILAARLLSVSPHKQVHIGCFLYLRRARAVALQWMREVGDLLHEEPDNQQQAILNLRLLEVAFTCHSTFDVDLQHVVVLLESSEDVAVITECCIIIHDRCPANIQQLPRSLQMLQRRFESLSYTIESMLRGLIIENQAGIDNTIKRVWAAYRPGNSWTSMSIPDERWMTTKTSGEVANTSSLIVHYNLLNGSLLVNGLPLTRLPRNYELHKTYQRIFCEKVLEVGPSTMQGMIFETRKAISGYQVHFRMDDDKTLVIRTTKEKQTYELIPMDVMLNDFPSAFVQEYAHWLDIGTNLIEWRPLTNIWTSSIDNWQITTDILNTFVLERGTKKLIDIHSPTAKTISQLLCPLEQATHIHIVYDHDTGRVEVFLPRMKLDFYLSHPQGLFQSRQFRGMVLDDQQSFGALTGLVNKLILRDTNSSSRTVIVPHGEVTFSPQEHHVRVMIDQGSTGHVKYHYYQIDSQLGRLVDNGSLQSRLFRLYLHAITSHCLVDNLTGRTGTEEALDGLQGGATRSFVKLESADIELLEKLACLTPRRQFYPAHLQVMQQVRWNSLSPLSQHCGFCEQVTSILDQAKSFQVFEDHPTQIQDVTTCGNRLLLEKARIRDSAFQVHGFGEESFSTSYDMAYIARDQSRNRDREIRTSQISKLVDDWSTSLTVYPSLLAKIESWGRSINGPDFEEDIVVGYSPTWLDEPRTFFPQNWCALHRFLANCDAEEDKYKIMIFLSTLSYSKYTTKELVHTLLALATVPGLRMITPPHFSEFPLADGYGPTQEKVVTLVTKSVRPFRNCPEFNIPELDGESKRIANTRRNNLYQHAKHQQIRSFAKDLIVQWPTSTISAPTLTQHGTYIVIAKAMEELRPCFQTWFQNYHFRIYIQDIQIILDGLCYEEYMPQQYLQLPPLDTYIVKCRSISFLDLVKNPAPRLRFSDRSKFSGWVVRHLREGTSHSKLKQLLDNVSSRPTNLHEHRYARDLYESFDALRKESYENLAQPTDMIPLLKAHMEQAQRDVEHNYQSVCDHLQAGSYNLVQVAQMLPRLSVISLLSYLTNSKFLQLPTEWKASLVDFGISITILQHATRLLLVANTKSELLKELANLGHENWEPIQYPEWLLFEIENGILIRDEQAKVAHEMISPSSGMNSVMQLNMGQGKSSVIVPITAASLADGIQLVRVIVLKPLAMQMFQLMAKKLGGMLNRRVFYMPVSRSLALNATKARQIHDLYETCMNLGGILLVQPEHILSFELMGLERLLAVDKELGQVMTSTQEWLRSKSRDILDESDEILSTRFELIYTIGLQRAIEYSPDRWTVIQYILGQVDVATDEVLKRFPHGLEVLRGQPGRFPKIRILQNEAGDVLLKMVAQQLCNIGMPGLPVWSLCPKAKAELLEYLTDLDSDSTTAQSVVESHFSSHSMRSGLLILKGLFACGILKFTLGQKRWRVNYGLDHPRTLLAVPYNAKDSPAARAEFSHPDAAIVLTCLAYYYGGLSDEQILACFETLLQSDRAPEEYERWVKDAPELPAKFMHLTGINLCNLGQCSREVFPQLRFAKAVIDFYTSAIVFPAEMKEFPSKLSSSGWDIAREKERPTTGFSGTNDSRYVLPLSISQCDLPAQRSTNAAVLDCVLRDRNTFVDIGQYFDTGVLNAEGLLNVVVSLEPKVRVILDVGAQVLELKNEELARTWLARLPNSEAQAVIFFDNSDLCVLSRDGVKERLLSSPFAKQMDQCLVYLDESHTRGTDLTLPADYRALVTLGPSLTKDRLMQACMRMRKLEESQSVVFCSSMEVRRKILAHCGRNEGTLSVEDVLGWSIAETCINTRRSIPLWATQGVRHQHRRAICSNVPITRDVAESLLEPEAQSLDQRYGNMGNLRENQVLSGAISETHMSRRAQLDSIRAKCVEFKVASFDTATLQEEQERELSPENEREQQVELPLALLAHQHYIHNDVRRLITDGIFNRFSDAFQPAFETFRNTTAFEHFESSAWPHQLLVTTDFTSTVQAEAHQNLNSFLRPVHWIVSYKSPSALIFVVISPCEAQELMPWIRKRNHVTLHTYSPRLNITARTMEDLAFCAIPAVPLSWKIPSVVPQLNLFAGQLYIRSYEEYELLCASLGLCSRPPDNEMDVASDGFISPASRLRSKSALVQSCSFKNSPVAFLRIVIALRRKGQSIDSSHMGKILSGELLAREQFLGD